MYHCEVVVCSEDTAWNLIFVQQFVNTVRCSIQAFMLMNDFPNERKAFRRTVILLLLLWRLKCSVARGTLRDKLPFSSLLEKAQCISIAWLPAEACIDGFLIYRKYSTFQVKVTHCSPLLTGDDMCWANEPIYSSTNGNVIGCDLISSWNRIKFISLYSARFWHCNGCTTNAEFYCSLYAWPRAHHDYSVEATSLFILNYAHIAQFLVYSNRSSHHHFPHWLLMSIHNKHMHNQTAIGLFLSSSATRYIHFSISVDVLSFTIRQFSSNYNIISRSASLRPNHTFHPLDKELSAKNASLYEHQNSILCPSQLQKVPYSPLCLKPHCLPLFFSTTSIYPILSSLQPLNPHTTIALSRLHSQPYHGLSRWPILPSDNIWTAIPRPPNLATGQPHQTRLVPLRTKHFSLSLSTTSAKHWNNAQPLRALIFIIFSLFLFLSFLTPHPLRISTSTTTKTPSTLST